MLTDPAAARTAWREILQLAQRRHWKYIEFRSDAEWLEGARPSGTFVGHSLRIDRPETELWQGLDDANRRAIRKAQRTELAVRFSADHDSVRAFYRLVCLTRRRQGLPPQPWSFFEQIQRHVLAPGKGFIVSAHYHDQMIAGAMFFRFRDLLLYKFGASDFQCQHLRANNLLMWEAIRRAGTDGVSRLDFGRTSVHHESLRRFKRSWGARELPLPYIRYDCSTSAFTTPPDRSSGWHTHLFRLLPAPLSRLLGQLLYRHVA